MTETQAGMTGRANVAHEDHNEKKYRIVQYPTCS